MLDNFHFHNNNLSYALLFMTIILSLAIFSFAKNKFNQPAVVFQLLIGVLISVLAHNHILFLQHIDQDQIVKFLALLGSIFLLFEIGLESNPSELRLIGIHSVPVILIGTLVPFVLGYIVVAPLVIKSSSFLSHIFIGALFAVTSTSISLSVLKEMGLVKSKVTQIILTASIVDDIFGLLMLTIITLIATTGDLNYVQISYTIILIVIFFIFCILFGTYVFPLINAKNSRNSNAQSLSLVAYCIFFSWLAEFVGLESIIGAFLAGLLIKDEYKANYNLINQFGRIFTPMFFIYAGMQVNIIEATSFKILTYVAIFSAFAIFSKVFCGIFLPKTINKWLVGFGMIPRGEIGIIFAITGKQLGVIHQEVFTAILMMIMITSILTPILLNILAKHENNKQQISI